MKAELTYGGGDAVGVELEGAFVEDGEGGGGMWTVMKRRTGPS